MRKRNTGPWSALRAALPALLLAGAGVASAAGLAPQDAAKLLQSPALVRPYAGEEMVLGVAQAGRRTVAVGDHGAVLLSDDGGRTFRQAKSVPTRVTLTAVAFGDASNGWAVGHGGVIVHTADAGETWQLQRSEMQVDRPLFTVHFSDARHGVAAGLWSLLLVTADGGSTWTPVALPPPPEGGKADRNLFAAFGDGKGALFIAAERGTVLRSDDGGGTWTYLSTGYKGSFWTGCALADGTLVVAGLRGTIYRSSDGGRNWQPATSGTKSSITQIAQVGDRVVAVGLDGVQLQSRDGGASFTAAQRDDSLVLTALSAAGDGKVRLYSKRGVVADPAPAASAAAPGGRP